jgi:ATP-dependent DNA helicase HFM1/MER3
VSWRRSARAHLADINSEIGLGTITSLRSAQDWLRRWVAALDWRSVSPLRVPRSSFLFIRIQQNSAYYASIAQEGREQQPNRTWEEWLEHYVEVSAIGFGTDRPLSKLRRRPSRTTGSERQRGFA